MEAAKLGWRPYGVEFDPEVARRVEGKTGLKVFSDPSALLNEAGGPADVLHLGDVIEHLTALDRQMPEILDLLKPGGILLAQGPLEGNPNLFLMFLRLSRSIGSAGGTRWPRITSCSPPPRDKGRFFVGSGSRNWNTRSTRSRGRPRAGSPRPTSPGPSAWLVRSASALTVGLEAVSRQAG